MLCKWCNRTHKNKTFCSHACRNSWVSYNNKTNNPVWDKSTRDKMARTLTGRKQDPQTVAKRAESIKKLYSDDPSRAYRQVRNLHEKYTSKIPPGWRKMRRKALERDSYTCQKCGVSKKRVMVHHKDHKGRNMPSQTQMNNDLSNLITLCYSCHASIHTWTVRRGESPKLL